MTNFHRISAALFFGFVAVHSDASRAQAIVLDGNGAALGILIEQVIGGGPRGAQPSPKPDSGFYTGSIYWLINENSYQFEIDWPRYDESGEMLPSARLTSFTGSIQFESSDCSGQPYYDTRHSGVVFAANFFDAADGAADPPSVYYVPVDETLQKRTFLSRGNWDGECSSYDPPLAYELSGRTYPNDPDITGFTDPAPPIPLTIRAAIDPDLARCIFRDGFECEA